MPISFSVAGCRRTTGAIAMSSALKKTICGLLACTFVLAFNQYTHTPPAIAITPKAAAPQNLSTVAPPPGDTISVVGADRVFTYGRDVPIIFIGGVPRSGTTLMRVMLDAHPDIRCGEESRVLPRLVGMRNQWYASPREVWRLEAAGLRRDVIDDAVAAFILKVIAQHGEPAPRLCNKDPFMMKSATYLADMFPGAKFLLMVRDGRATVHSVITRGVTISGFDLRSYRQCMARWNLAMLAMHRQCEEVGPTRCMHVYYEQLVLHPETELRKILKFLDVPWHDSVLHHDELIGKKISLSNVERSSDQVIKPVNLDALSNWVGKMPPDVIRDMPVIAPMLQVLHYDPLANPPNYGQPDNWVRRNTEEIEQHKATWAKKASLYVKNPNTGRIKSHKLSQDNTKSFKFRNIQGS
ncbi:PREDICTED: protein-tyrosine sulfotransferase 1-like [Priapulus caudatus]|uniref:Protein-tyrosine sulfotransferase n=1 Tax=Priapulus caudatus TaxID=37621 RepID=A0ABM1DR73_PRICU|nr:PREDICTED: protein-tyrosine sulfotransferase 1-like [Priapulus caudatus]